MAVTTCWSACEANDKVPFGRWRIHYMGGIRGAVPENGGRPRPAVAAATRAPIDRLQPGLAVALDHDVVKQIPCSPALMGPRDQVRFLSAAHHICVLDLPGAALLRFHSLFNGLPFVASGTEAKNGGQGGIAFGHAGLRFADGVLAREARCRVQTLGRAAGFSSLPSS